MMGDHVRFQKITVKQAVGRRRIYQTDPCCHGPDLENILEVQRGGSVA